MTGTTVEHFTFQLPMIPSGEPIKGKTYRADGWAYIDPPGRFSPDAWANLLSIIGDGEFVILARSSGRHQSDGKLYVRGQFLVSPLGWRNMQDHANSSNR